jgi:hypothetical protein
MLLIMCCARFSGFRVTDREFESDRFCVQVVGWGYCIKHQKVLSAEEKGERDCSPAKFSERIPAQYRKH